MTTATGEREKREIDLTAGRIRYRDSGGEGPPLVFVHGYLVDGRLWDGVVDALGDRFRCIAPDLPFGAHRIPMSPGADLSPAGLAAIVAELIERLELDAVTVVGNDSGGAVSQVLVTTRPELPIGRLVLTNCDTHDNFPPGIFKALPPLAKVPGSIWVMLQPVRIEAVARFAFGPFSRAGIPPAYIAAWSAGALGDAAIRRDLGKVTAGLDKRYTLAAAQALRRRIGQRPHRRDRGRQHLRPARPAGAARGRDRAVRGNALERQKPQIPGLFAKCRDFVRPGREALQSRSFKGGPPHLRTESQWPKRSSTRSALAARWRSA
jgi:pimeloyl-ACP methyl ester carboxylesterase